MKVESLDDLVESDLLEIPTATPLCVDLYLYLPQNGRIIHFIHKNDSFDSAARDQYEKKGLKAVWIAISDISEFEQWMTKHTQKKPTLRNSKNGEKFEISLARSSQSTNPNEQTPSNQNPDLPSNPQRNSNQGVPASKTGDSPPSPDSDPQASSAASTNASNSPGAPEPSTEGSTQPSPSGPDESPGHSTESNAPSPSSDSRDESHGLPNTELPMTPEQAHQSMMKAIEMVFPKLQDLMQQLFNLHGNFLPRSHGVHVALYSCLLSFAFKKAEPRTISVLTLASLFHDIGISRMTLSNVRAISHQGEPQVKEYSTHVQQGLELLKDYLGVVDSEVLDVIRDHHEHFDGSGYPGRKRSFEILTLSQILAMADTLDHLTTGAWDGTVRTLAQSLEAFLTLEKDSARPVYFLPDLYAKAKELIQSPDLQNSFLAAEERLRAITQEFIQKGSTPPSP